MATTPPFDDRDGFIWMNGRLLPWREAKVHFLTHALHYGSAVFEGLRSYNGRIFKLAEHSERLLNSCRLMDMRPLYSLAEINKACEETLKANNIADGYLRPLIWRGAEQMGLGAPQSSIQMAVAAWPWPNYFGAEGYDKGIKIKTSRWRRPAPDCAPVHAKASGLYIIGTLSRHDADKAGYTDSLMLDYRGYIAELTGANFFMVRNGELHTPVPDCFLDGITRRTVIGLAKDMGIKVRERVIMPEDIIDAEECFATGTAAEVTPIGMIDDRPYQVGPVTKRLRTAYEALVRA